MNAEHLLQHFDRLSEAPDAIPRLRRFILDLAVRGKLVEQDPNDEPAAELLKRIQSKKATSILPVTNDELPFNLPPGWSVTHFGDVYSLEYGDNLPAEKRSNTGEYPVYGSNGVVGSHFKCFVNSPCIVVGRKGSAGALNISLANGCCVTDVAYYCIPPRGLDLAFSFKLFHTLRLDSLGKGVKPGLSRNEAYVLPIAIPPLVEQHRIVAKVDELMALCDQLEAAKAEREQGRDRLVAASLQRLNQPADDEEVFHEHARFTFNNLPRLTTRSAHIKQMRQTILNLAVHGLLVPQDRNDIDVRVALTEAFKVKRNLVRNSFLPKRALPEAAYLSISPFELPTNWAFVNFDHLSAPALNALKAGPFGSALKKDSYIPQGYKVYGQEQVIGQNSKIGDYYISEAKFNQLKSCAVAPGDLLISLVGTIGKVLVLPHGCQEGIINPRLIKLSLNFDLVNPNYVQLLLGSPWVREFLFAEARGTTMDVLNLSILRSLPVPLPPLAEQRRIVAKVDKLMALCDQMEAQLNTTEADSRRLLEAVLHEALAPALEEAA